MTKPCTTKTTATNAKCAKSCAGACSTAETGSQRGSQEWQRPEAQLTRRRSDQPALSSGHSATEAKRVTGGDARSSELHQACTHCAEGQGRDCECAKRRQLDVVLMRLVMIGLVIVWLMAPVIALRGCSA